MKRLVVTSASAAAWVIAGSLLVSLPATEAASARRSDAGYDMVIDKNSDLLTTLKSSFGEDFVLLGRVDSVQPQGGVIALGQLVTDFAYQDVGVGDYVAVLGAPAAGGRIAGKLVFGVGSEYVPGASQVYLKGKAVAPVSNTGVAKVGSLRVDLTPALAMAGHVSDVIAGVLIEISGSQPSIGGVVIATDLGVVGTARSTDAGLTDGSLGMGRTDGSLGTGRTDGSLGTGRTDGSLGTGRTDGSLGTGRKTGSLGTGRTDGSLGTGRTDGSLGTGRTDGSLGTGRTDGSLGTGRTDGSLGTGRKTGSLGTGRTDGSLGTGRTDGSLGTGRTDGSLGTGRTDG